MLAKIAALPESLSIRNSSMTDLAGCSSLLWLGVVSTWSDDNISVCFFHRVTQVRSPLLDVVSTCFDNVLLSLCCCLFFYWGTVSSAWDLIGPSAGFSTLPQLISARGLRF